ncbi:MAG: ABC transporter permease [Anaerolineales bacterium]
MSTLFKIIGCEFNMSIRRWGMWVVFGVLCLVYLTLIVGNAAETVPAEYGIADWWKDAAVLAFQMNLFLPVAGGILASDRLVRDWNLNVIELLRSTPLGRRKYIFGKYIGTLFSLLAPVLLLGAVIALVCIALGAPWFYLPMLLVAFLAINVPAYAFLTVFSLACPLVMPLRVYQVLFTGYWFWGNFLNPEAIPTLAGTLLTPGGRFAMEGIFGANLSGPVPEHTLPEALANWFVLGLCIAAVFIVLDRYLARQERRD